MADWSGLPGSVPLTSARPYTPPAATASSASNPLKGVHEPLEDIEVEEAECSICYESAPPTWGVLDCCDHHFCYTCIRSWQNVNEQGEPNDLSSMREERLPPELSIQDAQAKNACPVCRRKVYLVMPTPKLFETEEEKEEAFEVYEDGLSETPCRVLMTSDPDFPYCPRGRECPYSHVQHGTGYSYAFRHYYADHLLATQRLAHERQGQHFMLALLSSGGLLASSILPTLPMLPDGVRSVVEELAGLIQVGEMGRFRIRIAELGNEEAWRRSTTERMWVGDGDEPTGENEEGEDWYDEVDEEDENQGGWEMDEDDAHEDEADDLPPLEPIRADGLGRLFGVPEWQLERLATREEDDSDALPPLEAIRDSEEEDDSDGPPPLEAISDWEGEEGSSGEEAANSENEDDDLPPLEEIFMDDLITAAATASTTLPPRYTPLSSTEEHPEADADLHPPHPSSPAPVLSPAPLPIPASISFASTFSSAFPSPRSLSPAPAPSVFPPSLAISGHSPTAAAQMAVQQLRASVSRPRPPPSSSHHRDRPHVSDEARFPAVNGAGPSSAELAAAWTSYHRALDLSSQAHRESDPARRAEMRSEGSRLMREYMEVMARRRAAVAPSDEGSSESEVDEEEDDSEGEGLEEETCDEESSAEEEDGGDDCDSSQEAAATRDQDRAINFSILASQESDPARRLALIVEANRLMLRLTQGRARSRSNSGDEQDQDEEDSDAGDSDEQDSDTDASDDSSTDDDTHNRPSPHAAPFLAPALIAVPTSSPSSDTPPPVPIRSMSRWTTSSTVASSTTSTTSTRTAVGPAQRERERRRKRAAQAAERRRAEEKWEEMD
ncbi:hypothetical protein JCM11251_003152 [Rhodosporidiobolus azoricus]